MSIRQLLDQGRQTVLEALDQALKAIEHEAIVEQRNVNDNQAPYRCRPAAESKHTLEDAEPVSQKKVSSKVPACQTPSIGQVQMSDSKRMPTSSDDQTLLRAELSRLQRKFNALVSNFKLAKEALEKRKNERDGWAQYASHLETLIRATENKHQIQILEGKSHVLKGIVPTQTVVTATHYETKINTSAADAAKCTPELPPLPHIIPHASQDLPNRVRTLDFTQSKSNDGISQRTTPALARETSVTVMVNTERSSDMPVVVSERIVKKRRHDDDLILVKQEVTNSSSPVVSSCKPRPNTQGSLDLGEIGSKVTTPRRRKEPESPTPATHTNSAFRPATFLPTPDVSAAKVARLPQPATALRQTVLTPVSVNARKFRPNDEKPSGRPLKPGLGRTVADPTKKDGSIPGDTSTAVRQHAKENADSKARLKMLSDSPSPAIGADSYPRTSSLEKDLIPDRRALPFMANEGENTTTFCKQNAPFSRSDVSISKPPVMEERRKKLKGNDNTTLLREKPISELQLDDFKINPSINDGHEFAFAEVVRDKGERACLPGCTDPSCCGKQFRALAISQRPDPPLTPAERMEEQKLLEGYLGDEAFRLASMTSEERMQVWIEAKTQELATKFGKHKHRFPRMQSPPGFWNPDFPTTQELEAERAEALNRQRQVVAARYREAMRPNGKWLFRDE